MHKPAMKNRCQDLEHKPGLTILSPASRAFATPREVTVRLNAHDSWADLLAWF